MTTTIPVTQPARGVYEGCERSPLRGWHNRLTRTPALLLIAERENEPVAGYAPNRVPIVLVTPIAICEKSQNRFRDDSCKPAYQLLVRVDLRERPISFDVS